MSGLKAKTIRAVLRKKIDAWLESLPEEMRDQVKRDTIVTGGSIASMLIGEKVNDFDLYFRTKETALLLANHYVKEFQEYRAKRGGVPVQIWAEQIEDVRGKPRVRIVCKSAGIESEKGASDYTYFEGRPDDAAQDYVSEVMNSPEEVADLVDEIEEAPKSEEGKPFRPVFVSSNAISLSGKIQVILRFFGEPDEIHENYDFVHCTSYWTARDGELVLRPEAMQALLSRTLVYQGSRYPLCSLIRVRKFVQRGWRINAGQILKMCLQLNELDLKSYAVLEDQLTGVDVAYFAQVLERCKEKGAETIDSAYLIEIVNRMFGE